MRRIGLELLVATIAVALAGCSTAPAPAPVAPVIAAKPAGAELPYRWTQGNAPRAYRDMLATFGPLNLKPGQYRWVADVPAQGEANIVIDLLTQHFYVYRGDRLVGVSTISSGKKGKETPLGFWSVMIKKKNGYSRKYDNAPMPYMQMYDPKGIAFHGGPLPGYPASHGCVRLPVKFAERLFGLTKIGTKITIEG